MYKIYKLICPISNETRYIGVTTGKLSNRLAQHVYDGRHKKGSYKINWIKNLLEKEKRPIIELIEECTEKNWREREKYWISCYNNLTNSTEGGAGVVLNRDRSSIERSIEAHRVPIVQIDRNNNYIKRFSSIKEASIELNIGQTNISEVLNKRNLTTKGFHFVRESEYTDTYYIDLSKSFIRSNNEVILILKNGEKLEFDNKRHLADYLNVNYKSLLKVLKEGFNNKKRRKFKNVKDMYIK